MAPEYSSEQALVVSDERAHWDELPPNRRVSAALAAGAATMVAVGAGGAMWVAPPALTYGEQEARGP